MAADAADIIFADGTLTIAGTDRSIPIAQVAQMQFIETRNYRLRREHALGQLLLSETDLFFPYSVRRTARSRRATTVAVNRPRT